MKPETLKRKIFNDPIYGFITVPDELIFELINHPWFQRLRRIKQLGLTNLVYPGALHTRFHHALGAMHLMSEALDVLRMKGHVITDEEARAATIAILLHDIGHGPFSHALEHTIVEGVSHETLSELFMTRLNKEFNGRLDLAILIFRNRYKKKFLHQLVSSQLDVDRLDYLKRDSFFTGVSEGIVSSDRIIKMMNVVHDELVVEMKGIYSVEKFIIARRLMYWQVYLHKTVLSAENLLVNILKRARELAQTEHEELFCTPALKIFLYHRHSEKSFKKDPQLLQHFADLDDHDVMTSIKVWVSHTDRILSLLCHNLINRHLYAVELQKKPFDLKRIAQLKQKAKQHYHLAGKDLPYLVFSADVSNDTYRPDKLQIKILAKDGTVVDISEASDQLGVNLISHTVRKYFLCYPKEIR
ncbi:MAG: HD domain-containing protein [Bacteroidia bacterium]